MAMTTQNLNLIGLLSETKRIVNAHSRHFLALSVLFLLPLSFSVVVYPSLSRSPLIVSLHQRSMLFAEFDMGPIEKPSLLLMLYALFVLLFSLCGIASITYSTFHGFYGRPVKFVASIKSIIFSFFPLVSTAIVATIIVGLVAFSFWGFTMLLFVGVSMFGVEIDLTSPYTMGFIVIVLVCLAAAVIYLKIEWCLWNVVVIVESRWGFSPLKRSSYLIKGMKRLALGMLTLFGCLTVVLSLMFATLLPSEDGIEGSWIRSAFIFQIVIYTGFLTILMLYNVAAITVLFMHCKALHGELAIEIAEEFSREYISLPFDDGKVPHVVYVV